jgi:hypothetical protein
LVLLNFGARQCAPLFTGDTMTTFLLIVIALLLLLISIEVA